MTLLVKFITPGDAEKADTLVSLRLSPSQAPGFESAYLKNVNSYQKVVNYKNIYHICLYIFVVDNLLIASPVFDIYAFKVGQRESVQKEECV